jgi:hypothetical protein
MRQKLPLDQSITGFDPTETQGVRASDRAISELTE